MSKSSVLDVSGLPDSGFGPASTPWWGTLGFMAAEGATLLLCAATYLYLADFTGWPPPGTRLPDLLAPTITLAMLLGSLILTKWLDHAARRKDAAAIGKLLVLGVVVEAAILVPRAFEFVAVHVRWDTHAYGSIIWFTLGIHTLLLAADLAETAVFAAIFRTGRVEEKHYADVADVALYWQFVVLSWVPLYLLLYLSPRFL